MATDGNTPSKKIDDPERAGTLDRPTGGGVALADEGDVAFGAMAGIAVISAVLVSMLALAGFFGYQAPDRGADTMVAHADEAEADDAAHDEDDDAHGDDDAAHDEDSDDDEAAEAEAEAQAAADAEAEAAAAAAAEAAAEAEAAELAAEEAAAAEAAAAGSAAVVTASQSSISLDGTVPDQATADALVAAAVASGYTDDQITNNLEIAESALPYTLTMKGSLTSEAGAASLGTNFGETGAALADDFTFDDQLELIASSDLEADLNALVAATPILFNSGTDVITAETAPVVAQVAELLLAGGDETVEIGGHTDSRGGDAGNLALSDLRAARVVQELVALGVDADRLVAKGYGETQLVEDPDDTQALQQANRRIEFRVLG